MNNDKFVNYYMELLTTTFHDALGKNLVFQVQARIANEEIDNLKAQVENFQNVLEEYKQIEEQVKQTSNELVYKEEQILALTAERDTVKHENSHIETFRNELILARSQIREKQEELEKVKLEFIHKEKNMLSTFNKNINTLKQEYEIRLQEAKEKIEYLQMTPAKRKKFDSTNSTKTVVVEDGGFF